VLMQLLERRLDNVVRRSGFVRSICHHHQGKTAEGLPRTNGEPARPPDPRLDRSEPS
jgi:hypothetical protein